jgi:hypothetical protein
MCLPVFLSGCSTLLVLYSDTYLSRLWCVTEIFVFLQVRLCARARAEPGPRAPSQRDLQSAASAPLCPPLQRRARARATALARLACVGPALELVARGDGDQERTARAATHALALTESPIATAR